jgi:hypothetical protein
MKVFPFRCHSPSFNDLRRIHLRFGIRELAALLANLNHM